MSDDATAWADAVTPLVIAKAIEEARAGNLKLRKLLDERNVRWRDDDGG